MKERNHRFQISDLSMLQRMNGDALLHLHAELCGNARPIANPASLRRKLAWQLQADTQGGLPDAAKRRALTIGEAVQLRTAQVRRKAAETSSALSSTAIPIQDSRLPMVGSLLVKKHKGRNIIVKVLEDGFECEGRQYGSLSAIAKEITGTKWNGYVFFGLEKENQRER